MDLLYDIGRLPDWVLAWIIWVYGLNAASLAVSIESREARVVALAFAVNVAALVALHDSYGFSRLISVAPATVWGALAVWLANRREALGADSLAGMYLRMVLATNAIAVTVDVIRVLLYLFAGDA